MLIPGWRKKCKKCSSGGRSASPLLGEPDFGDGFAFTGFHPGPHGKGIAVEAADDLAGEQALLFDALTLARKRSF